MMNAPQSETSNKWLPIIVAIVLSSLALIAFMYKSDIMSGSVGSLVLFGITLFLLVPYRKESVHIQRMIILSSLLFILWMIIDLGIILLPFVLSFLLAYLLDPLVTKLSKWKISRTIISLLFVLVMVTMLVLISVFVFPSVFEQINDVIRRISSLLGTSTQYLESNQFKDALVQFGISVDMIENLVQKELVPRLEILSQYVLRGLLSVLTSLSSVLAQAINVILVPILTFYFLNDLPNIKELIISVLSKSNAQLLNDIRRINGIVRAYISGQIISATFVAVMATILFVLFDVPYSVVLGVLCGFLNPIPYVGILTSIFLAIITIVIVNPPNIIELIFAITIIVLVLHFITTYFIDPRVTGSKVGVHPVLLIASLFVFGHFFGFGGLIIAVPLTAVLMMYFNDWRQQQSLQFSSIMILPDQTLVTASPNQSDNPSKEVE